MPSSELLKLLSVSCFFAIFLLGCRAEERNRFVHYEPGVYKGKIDSELSDKQRKSLRLRSLLQGSGMSASGPSIARKSVRKPDEKESVIQSLKKRLQNQSDGGNK